MPCTHLPQAPHPSDFDPTNTTLFIGGLSPSVSEDALRAVFARFGDIIYVKIPQASELTIAWPCMAMSSRLHGLAWRAHAEPMACFACHGVLFFELED